MELITYLAAVITEVGVVMALLIPIWRKLTKVLNGTKCQLRSDMLRIYYKNQETKVIRQYEYENFMIMYQEYKALGGNSFIDKIAKEVETWKVIN